MLAGELDRLGLLSGQDVEGEPDDAVLDVARHLVAGVLEHHEHLAVLREHLRHEARDADLRGDGREVLEQDRADSLALHVVRDVEGHLGARGLDAVEAADTDDLAVEDRDQGDAVVVVDVGEAVDVTVAQLTERGKDAEVDGLVGLAVVELPQPVRVSRRDRADVRNRAVPEHDVGLPLDGRLGQDSSSTAFGPRRHGLRAPSAVHHAHIVSRRPAAPTA